MQTTEQPDSFMFSSENVQLAQLIIERYPEGRQASAVIPLLDLAQRQEGWISEPVMEVIAELLKISSIRVLEVASFYTMFNLEPVGKHHVQVCTNLSCWLSGSEDVVRACKDSLGVGFGETTLDGKFTLNEIECAGACVNAPVVQIDDNYFEDINYDFMTEILDAFKKGQRPAHGSQTGRNGSCPKGGATSLSFDPTEYSKKQDLTAAKAAFEESKSRAMAKGNVKGNA